MSFDSLLLFVLAGLLLNLTPGPDVLYIVSNAARHGVRAGLVAALGITAGCFVHILAAALGVSALLATSATAFTLLKWLGAAYLVYVGWTLLAVKSKVAIDFEASHAGSTEAVARIGYRSIFLRGFATNALNPKVALFFLAFVPQFIGPAVAHKAQAFLLLGLLFNLNGLWVNMGWALLADRLVRRTHWVRKHLLWLDRAAGALFVGFGIKLALTEAPHS